MGLTPELIQAVKAGAAARIPLDRRGEPAWRPTTA